jgi:flagellar L-ring protein precursor FlgH
MTARTPTLLLCLLASGCGTLSRLSEIGRPPEMTATADPTKEPIYRPLTMPMPAPQVATAQVGDILTVLVNMTDAADVIDNTTSSRTGSEAMGLPNLFGLEASVPKMLAGAVASSLISANSTNSNNGAGEIKRNETVTLRVAGVITQVLPNGNLVVAARQEFRVNSELRQLQVTGVVRPQDIASDNTVIHDRMAEARISYGGRGQLTDLQTPRWGQQVIDTLAPF